MIFLELSKMVFSLKETYILEMKDILEVKTALKPEINLCILK